MTGVKIQKKVLLVGPSREALGGVANYYRTIYPMLEEPGLDISYFPIGSAHASFGFLSPLWDQIRLAAKLVSYQPDLVHVNPSFSLKSFLRDMLFITMSRLSGAKCVVFFRGWQVAFVQKIEDRFLWLFKRTYGNVDLIIVLAQEFRDKLVDWQISAPVVIETTTVPDLISRSFDLEVKLELQRKSEPVTVVYMGRLDQGKGIMEMLSAVELLGEKGLDVPLVIAGAGSIEDDVRRRIKESQQLRSQVEFVGYVRDEDKIAVMLRGDIFCLISSGEGMPNALLEAMAFGMALITCPTGGIKDIVIDGENGFFVEQQDIEDIAGKMEALNSDRLLLSAIAVKNCHLAQERFMASKVSRRLLNIYKRVLGDLLS
jgi:glycosyltransferase involved in cell wall biosynthesis